MWKLESERLYARAWQDKDFEAYCELNRNEEVMRYFPSTYSDEDTRKSMNKMIANFEESKYAYLPCFEKSTDAFIGWVGLMNQEMANHKFVDIGWRLSPKFWGKAYAPEMARQFLKYGFEECQLEEIYAIAPKINLPSISVMEKIGMHFESEFKHPSLAESPLIETCVRYQIKSTSNKLTKL